MTKATKTTRYTILLADEDLRRVERLMRVYLHDSVRSSIRFAIRRQAKRPKATKEQLKSCQGHGKKVHLVAIPMNVIDREALRTIMNANGIDAAAPAVRLAIRTQVKNRIAR